MSKVKQPSLSEKQKEMIPTKAKIDMVKGVEGDSLYLIDHRIAGNKPWGGGTLLKTWNTTIENILTAIATNQKQVKKVYNFWYNGNYKITIERIKK